MPTVGADHALHWLLHESEAATELRRRVWAVTARIELEGATDYLDHELQRAEETLVTVHLYHRGWQAAAARAWNRLPAYDRQLLCLRHLAHRMGPGQKAAGWWRRLTDEGRWQSPDLARALVSGLASAELRFAADYHLETHRRAR